MCPEDPNMYELPICDCIYCEDTLIKEEGINKRICLRCNCDKLP